MTRIEQIYAAQISDNPQHPRHPRAILPQMKCASLLASRTRDC